MPKRPTLGAFDVGQKPIIIVINKAKTPLGVDLDALIAACQKQIAQFVSIWGTGCDATLRKDVGFVKGCWAIVLTDTADQAGALGYHDLTPDGLPLSHVFVKTTIDDGEKVSVTFSHELLEMLLDPGIQLLAEGPKNVLYCYEASDAVESYSYDIDGITVSDWLFPSFFEGFHPAKSRKFDWLGKVTHPFQTLQGGYQITLHGGTWGQVHGDESTAARLKAEDRRKHRQSLRGVPIEGRKKSVTE